MKKNVLLTGANGMVGSFLSSKLKNQFNLYKISKKKNVNNNVLSINFLNKNIKKNFKKINNFFTPEVIIHCAAITNIDYCEKNKNECNKVNYIILKKMVKFFPKAKIVFISSDAVFSKKTRIESSKTSPLNYYGKVKVKAEKFLIRNKINNCIIRCTPVGFEGSNKKKTLVSWIYNSLKKNFFIKLFDDNFFTPISLNFLSKVIIKVIKKDIQGIIHVGSKNVVSKYNFGLLICKKFKFCKNHILKSSLLDYKFLSKRSLNQSLVSTNLERILKLKLPTIKKIIDDLYYEKSLKNNIVRKLN